MVTHIKKMHALGASNSILRLRKLQKQLKNDGSCLFFCVFCNFGNNAVIFNGLWNKWGKESKFYHHKVDLNQGRDRQTNNRHRDGQCKINRAGSAILTSYYFHVWVMPGFGITRGRGLCVSRCAARCCKVNRERIRIIAAALDAVSCELREPRENVGLYVIRYTCIGREERRLSAVCFKASGITNTPIHASCTQVC